MNTSENITNDILAAAAYTAYSQAVGGVAYNGDKLPNWESFSADPAKTKQASAWLAAVAAVKESLGIVEKKKPWKAPELRLFPCAYSRNTASELEEQLKTSSAPLSFTYAYDTFHENGEDMRRLKRIEELSKALGYYVTNHNDLKKGSEVLVVFSHEETPAEQKAAVKLSGRGDELFGLWAVPTLQGFYILSIQRHMQDHIWKRLDTYSPLFFDSAEEARDYAKNAADKYV